MFEFVIVRDAIKLEEAFHVFVTELVAIGDDFVISKTGSILESIVIVLLAVDVMKQLDYVVLVDVISIRNISLG